MSPAMEAMYPAKQIPLEKKKGIWGVCVGWVDERVTSNLYPNSLNPGFPIFQMAMTLVHFRGWLL